MHDSFTHFGKSCDPGPIERNTKFFNLQKIRRKRNSIPDRIADEWFNSELIILGAFSNPIKASSRSYPNSVLMSLTTPSMIPVIVLKYHS